MPTLFLPFFLAHLVGDFLIQPYTWVKDKESRKVRSPYLYIHVLIHFALLWLAVAFDTQYWLGLLIIAFSHLLIDILKLYAQNHISPRKAFFTDQLLHVAVLIAVVQYYEPANILSFSIYTPQILLILTSILLCTSVSSIIMRVIITRWNIDEDTTQHSLKDAGNFIGILERLLVFVFIITGHWEGVGFLLAAKSVFRFGDLSRAQDRKMTEYVLIGTMLSFGMAILTALGYLYVEKLI